MAKGYYLVLGDKTTCGGRIIEGATDHLLFGKPQARDGDKVICGQHPGIYVVAGGIPGDTIHGRMIAGTLHSVSSCPCRARLVPSILEDCYEKGEGSASSGNNATQPLPSYLTGEKNLQSLFLIILYSEIRMTYQMKKYGHYLRETVMMLCSSRLLRYLKYCLPGGRGNTDGKILLIVYQDKSLSTTGLI